MKPSCRQRLPNNARYEQSQRRPQSAEQRGGKVAAHRGSSQSNIGNSQSNIGNSQSNKGSTSKSSSSKVSVSGQPTGADTAPATQKEKSSCGRPLPAKDVAHDDVKERRTVAEKAKDAAAFTVLPLMLGMNFRLLAINRHLAALVAGTVAGVLGLEGLNGFVAYILCTLSGSAVLLLEARFDAKTFFVSPRDIFFAQFFSAFLTFVLVWTLVYNAVYIF